MFSPIDIVSKAALSSTETSPTHQVQVPRKSFNGLVSDSIHDFDDEDEICLDAVTPVSAFQTNENVQTHRPSLTGSPSSAGRRVPSHTSLFMETPSAEEVRLSGIFEVDGKTYDVSLLHSKLKLNIIGTVRKGEMGEGSL